MAALATSIQQPHQHPEEEASWAELPSELVYLIMDNLSSSPHFMLDYTRVGSVCTTWYSLFYNHKSPPPPLPLLMVPPSLNKKKKHRTRLRRFYNVCNNKIDSSLQVRMPRYRHCRGSSHGWLITVDDNDDDVWLITVDENNGEENIIANNNDIRLFNPFMYGTGIHEIVLPSLYPFPLKIPYHYSSLKKAVLSANPISNPTNYTVMAIYGNSHSLAFFKPGNKVWTPVKLPRITKDSKKGYFEDVIYCQGQFYAVHCSGAVVVCDDNNVVEGGMVQKASILSTKFKHKCTKKYIVESSEGKLMQVHRDEDFHQTSDGKTIYSTVGFRVYQFVLHTIPSMTAIEKQEGMSRLEKEGTATTTKTDDSYKWVEVKNLCGDTMFLGHNASISISASNYPGCKPNCIYFTDDSDYYVENNQIGPHDMGVFNLEDGSIEKHFPIDPKNISIHPIPIWPVPIWIQPTVPKSTNNNTASIFSDEE